MTKLKIGEMSKKCEPGVGFYLCAIWLPCTCSSSKQLGHLTWSCLFYSLLVDMCCIVGEEINLMSKKVRKVSVNTVKLMQYFIDMNGSRYVAPT